MVHGITKTERGLLDCHGMKFFFDCFLMISRYWDQTYHIRPAAGEGSSCSQAMFLLSTEAGPAPSLVQG